MSRFLERGRLHSAVLATSAFLLYDRPVPALIAAGFFLGLEASRTFDEYDLKTNPPSYGRGRFLRVVFGKRPKK